MMSAVRLLPLLAVSLVLCLSLPVLTVGVNPPDPTIGCFGIAGTGTTGIYQSDSGYYGMYGLQSYSSATYDILCAWRGLYYYGPHGQTNVYAPWHGNPKEDTADCDIDLVNQLGVANDWCEDTTGYTVSRNNSATNTSVVTLFVLGGVCSSNYLCGGAACEDGADYSSLLAAQMADPTKTVTHFGSASGSRTVTPFSSSASSGCVPNQCPRVISTLNGTHSTTTMIASPNPGQYPTKVMSVIMGIQECYGFFNVNCTITPPQ